MLSLGTNLHTLACVICTLAREMLVPFRGIWRGGVLNFGYFNFWPKIGMISSFGLKIGSKLGPFGRHATPQKISGFFGGGKGSSCDKGRRCFRRPGVSGIISKPYVHFQ